MTILITGATGIGDVAVQEFTCGTGSSTYRLTGPVARFS